MFEGIVWFKNILEKSGWMVKQWLCLKTVIDGCQSGTVWKMMGRVRKQINVMEEAVQKECEVCKSSDGAVTEGCF